MPQNRKCAVNTTYSATIKGLSYSHKSASEHNPLYRVGQIAWYYGNWARFTSLSTKLSCFSCHLIIIITTLFGAEVIFVMALVCVLYAPNWEWRDVWELKASHALFTSAGAAWEQTEVVQHWKNGSGKEDPKQERTRWNKEKSKYDEVVFQNFNIGHKIYGKA